MKIAFKHPESGELVVLDPEKVAFVLIVDSQDKANFAETQRTNAGWTCYACAPEGWSEPRLQSLIDEAKAAT